MKSLFIGRLACDDSHLKGMSVLTVNDLKDVLSAALTFTPFTIAQINLVYARVAEKYFLACGKLGYKTSFFREMTALTYFTLTMDQANIPKFDGIYIPFSGEIFILPYDVCEFADAQEGSCDAEFAGAGTPEKRFFRRFTLEIGKTKTSFTQAVKQKLLGEKSETVDVTTIAMMTATADVCVKTKPDGSTEEEVLNAMYFLYNGMK